MTEGPFHKLVETFIAQHGADGLPAMLAQKSASEHLCMLIRNLWDLTNREKYDAQLGEGIPQLFLQLLEITGARRHLPASLGGLPGASVLESPSFAEHVERQVGCLGRLLEKALIERITQGPATPCLQLMDSLHDCLRIVLHIGAMLPAVDSECVSQLGYTGAPIVPVVTF